MLRDLFLELFIRNLFFLRRKSMPYNELLRVRPISSSPLRVRPYLMPCSPPHFSSSTPSSRVRPLIEWYPDELICDEGTSRMCQMSRQRRPFWISAIAILCAGSGNTRNNCIHWTCDKENHTLSKQHCLTYYLDWKRCKPTSIYLTNTKCSVDKLGSNLSAMFDGN